MQSKRTNGITLFAAMETECGSIANNRRFNRRHYFSVRSNYQRTCWAGATVLIAIPKMSQLEQIYLDQKLM